MTRTADRLRAIADEIEAHSERWGQGAFAFDAEGQEIDNYNIKVGSEYEEEAEEASTAVCWCALGFVYRDSLNVEGMVAALALAAKPLVTWNTGGIPVIPAYNDAEGRTAAEIADLFRKAAEIAEAKS